MVESIKRSGYLFEAEIAQYLEKAGYFVQSNMVIKDESTGKSRDIDMLAEFYRGYDQERVKAKCKCKIEFVIEVKNNPVPLVQLNQFSWTPLVESLDGLKEEVIIPNSIDYTPMAIYNYFIE